MEAIFIFTAMAIWWIGGEIWESLSKPKKKPDPPDYVPIPKVPLCRGEPIQYVPYLLDEACKRHRGITWKWPLEEFFDDLKENHPDAYPDFYSARRLYELHCIDKGIQTKHTTY